MVGHSKDGDVSPGKQTPETEATKPIISVPSKEVHHFMSHLQVDLREKDGRSEVSVLKVWLGGSSLMGAGCHKMPQGTQDPKCNQQLKKEMLVDDYDDEPQYMTESPDPR